MQKPNVFIRFSNAFTNLLGFLSDVVPLLLRIWLFKSFFFSGLNKFNSWETTIELFNYEYKVPLISPYLAAVLGTTAELILPVLVLIGFGARIPTVAFFIFNAVTVVGYPFLLEPEGYCALKDHIGWGIGIAVIMAYGHGRLSADHLIQKHYPAYRY